MGYIIGTRLDASQPSDVNDEGKGFSLGDRNIDHSGNEWVYVQAAAAITAFDTVHVSPAYAANALTTALAPTSGYIGFAQFAFTTSEKGWVMARGKPTIRVAGAAAKDVPLYTTSTAGVLDDAATTAEHQILSVVLLTANGSTASSGVAAAPFPTVGPAEA